MGDLISRKAVMDIIQGELNLNTGYDADIALFSVKKCVSELPTAYNVEKVVEELEERKGNVIIDGKIMYQENYFIDIDSAIDIVKAGGVDD